MPRPVVGQLVGGRPDAEVRIVDHQRHGRRAKRLRSAANRFAEAATRQQMPPNKENKRARVFSWRESLTRWGKFLEGCFGGGIEIQVERDGSENWNCGCSRMSQCCTLSTHSTPSANKYQHSLLPPCYRQPCSASRVVGSHSFILVVYPIVNQWRQAPLFSTGTIIFLIQLKPAPATRRPV